MRTEILPSLNLNHGARIELLQPLHHQLFLQLIKAWENESVDSYDKNIEHLIPKLRKGPLIPQIAEVINADAETLQEKLLKSHRLPILSLNRLLNTNVTSRTDPYQQILGFLGIVPLHKSGHLLTILAETPLAGEVAMQACQAHKLPIRWCHTVTVRTQDLSSYFKHPQDSLYVLDQ